MFSICAVCSVDFNNFDIVLGIKTMNTSCIVLLIYHVAKREGPAYFIPQIGQAIAILLLQLFNFLKIL